MLVVTETKSIPDKPLKRQEKAGALGPAAGVSVAAPPAHAAASEQAPAVLLDKTALPESAYPPSNSVSSLPEEPCRAGATALIKDDLNIIPSLDKLKVWFRALDGCARHARRDVHVGGG
jgi:hypothetical protein